MAKTTGFFSEERLNKAIWLTAGLIVVALVVLGGYIYYQNYPASNVPPLVQKSIDEAKAKVTKDPQNANLRVELARLYLGVKKYDEAIAELNQAVKLEPKNVGALALLGVAYEEKGQQSRAVDFYKKAIDAGSKEEMQALNPFLYEAQYRLANIYIEDKQYDPAIKVLEGALKNNPFDSDLQYLTGQAFLGKGDYDKAIVSFEEAIKYVPNFAEAHYGLGQAYERKGEKERAIAAYEQALKYKANYREAKEALERLE